MSKIKIPATVPAAVSLLALVAVSSALYLRAANGPIELTLPQFLAQIRDQNPPQQQDGSGKRAEEVFFQLAASQGREAAARQSLDRLSGWHEAAQVRLEAQSIPPLEVDMLRFSEARAAAQAAQRQAERRTAMGQANLLLGRVPYDPLVALAQAFPLAASDNTEAQSGIPLVSGEQPEPPLTREEWTQWADRKAQFEKQLLPQGRDLLAKMYQSYLLDGTPLSALLRQEQEVYRTELQYRLLLVEAEKRLASAGS